MEVYRNSTDSHGFDYMANTGVEEQDRDWVGIIIGLAVMVFLTLTQYWGWY